MISHLLYVVSLVSSGVGHSGFVETNKKAELMEGDGAPTGALIVKMGPVTNVHVEVEDVRVISGDDEVALLPAITPKGSLFEGFSHNPVHAIRYGRN